MPKHRDNGDAQRLEQGFECNDSRSVCPKPSTRNQRLPVQPDHVAALGGSLPVNGSKDGYAPGFECLGKRRPLAATCRFSSLKNDGTPVCDQNGIVRVKGIQTGSLINGKAENVRSRRLQERNKLAVISGGAIKVRQAKVIQLFPFPFNHLDRSIGFVGPLDHDRTQRSDHALATERSLALWLTHLPWRTWTSLSRACMARSDPRNRFSGNSSPEATMLLKMTSA